MEEGLFIYQDLPAQRMQRPDNEHLDMMYKAVDNLFGDPYPELIAFFDTWPTTGEALDLGAGQGRDALYLARRGYTVTAVEPSEIAVHQMLTKAEAEGLKIMGVVGEMQTYQMDKAYDLIVLDMVLHHMSEHDRDRVELLDRVVAQTKPNGLVCIVTPERSVLVENRFHRWEKLYGGMVTQLWRDEDYRFDMMIAQNYQSGATQS